MFHTYVATILSGCCICFNGFQEFSCVFASASNALLQVFQLFRTNVASVSSRCFKSRSTCCTSCKVTHLS
jgi:hypothetical protein